MKEKRIVVNYIITFLSSSFLAFGLYNIHSLSSVTEGGVLGMTLFLEHWFNISPALSGAVMNGFCYLIGWKLIGKFFIKYSIVAAVSFSVSYKFYELFPPLFPKLANMPLLAAFLGAIFVGLGTGICVKIGGAPNGDDALAMSISHITGWNIQWVYLMTDIIVLILSLSYIPIRRIGYSVITILLSGQLIGIVQNFSYYFPKNNMNVRK